MSRLYPIDLVVPVLNEERETAAFLNGLAAQVDDEGAPLPAGILRVIVVDSYSTDRTRGQVEAAPTRHPQLDVVLLQEPPGSHVEARRHGAEFALAPRERERSAILASADVDTRFHPRWIADIGRRLGADGFDAVTYAGHYPAAFWASVPRLAARYFEEVGTVFFPAATIDRYGFPVAGALFRDELFTAFTRVPSDCAWAYTKEAYALAGGYRRERRPDGSEVMFEGRNLRFRLDRIGARVAYVDETPFETSPRRLLFEAERLLAGSAYLDGLVPVRGEVTPAHVEALEELAGSLDFEELRRYVVKHYILLPAVSRPQLLEGNARFLGAAFGRAREAILAAADGLKGAAAVHDLADALLAEHGAEIVATARRARDERVVATR